MRSFTQAVTFGFTLVLVSLAGVHCGDDAPAAAPSGDGGADATKPTPAPCTDTSCAKVQAVARKITLPTKKSDFAADLDGDGNPDNALGSFLATLSLAGFNGQATQDSKVG